MEQRQLRPIYEALDRRDYKAALKESMNLLRKNPNHLSGQALMSLALARTGDTHSAMTLGQKVLNTAGALKNPHVLQCLPMTFRLLGHAQEEAAVYTGAQEFFPNDKAICAKLFMVAASNGMYKEQHQAAVSLLRLTKDDKYMWWVVVSLVLLTKFSKEDEKTRQMQLALAERMAEKSLEQGRLTTTEELRIYLEVLDIQSKHADMLAVLSSDSPLAEKISNDPDLVTQRISLLLKTDTNDKAVEAAVRALNAKDNWADYKLYAEATIGQISEGEREGELLITSFCETVQKWTQIRGRARGAELALVELVSGLYATGHQVLADKTVGPLGKQMWKYIDQFQSKAICFADITQYFVKHVKDTDSLHALGHHRAQVDSRLHAARSATSQGEDQAQAWVTLEKIRYLLQALSGDTSVKSWAEGTDQLLSHGLNSKAAERKQASCTDAVLLASQRLIQAAYLSFSASADRGQLASSLFAVLCVLEAGIKQNDDGFILKIYAIRLYLLLSCYDRARALFDSLNVKSIQLDTHSYLINGQGMALGCFTPDLDLCYTGVGFYDRVHIKVTEHLDAAYMQGTYSNVLDFIEFGSNLRHSVQRECTHRCALRGEGFEPGCADDVLAKWTEADVVSIEHTEESLAKLHDNRDIKAMSLLAPQDLIPYNLEVLTRPTPLPGTQWIQMYSLIPQIIHHIVMADTEALETKARSLLLTVSEAGDLLSAQDKMLACGINQIATLYTRASDSQQSFNNQLDDLLATIRQGLSQDIASQEVTTLEAISSTLLRDITTATEIYTYAITACYALESQRAPSARAVRQAFMKLRKEALQRMAVLRSLANGYVRGAIDEHWVGANVGFSGPIFECLSLKRKSVIDSVAKNCFNGWIRSIKNLVMQWEQCS
ncbi:mitochondrial distribution and morphology [Kickxella alabastrina]|nr:mitochondrial distribution and morphology [Kickxella alabastrina]